LYAIYGNCEEGSNISGTEKIDGKEYINIKKIGMRTLITIDVNGIEYKICRKNGYTRKKK